jgi:hypothetical protein
MIKATLLALALTLSPSLYAIRAGKSITVNSTDMTINTKVSTVVDRSVWTVWYTSLTPLYNSFAAMTSPCLIAKTGSSFSVKVGAFNQVYSYVQTGSGELNLTKTEIITKSTTSRQIVVWTFTTLGYSATMQCTVEVQTLKNKVWTTTTPATVWLKSYASVVNFESIIN